MYNTKCKSRWYAGMVAMSLVLPRVQAGVAVGPVTIPTPSGTSSSAGSSSTPSTPVVTFSDFGQLQTCVDQFLTWTYVGQSQALRVAVTNNGVQGPVPNPNAEAVNLIAKRASINETLFTQPANFEDYLWNVNVPEGFYVLDGILASGQTSVSQVFQVLNGSDTSCIIGGANVTSTTLSSTRTSTSASQTTSPSSTGTSSSSTTSQTGILTSPSNASKTNTGAIVGGVVGAIVIILIVLAATWYLCRVAPAKRRAQLGGSEKRRWGDLASADSAARIPSQAQTAPVLGRVRAAAGVLTPGGSDEDVRGLAEIKTAPGNLGTTIMPLAYDSRSSFTPSVIAPSPIRTKVPSARVSRGSLDGPRSSSTASQPNPKRMSRTRSGGAVGVQSMPERAVQRKSIDLTSAGVESIPMARTGSMYRTPRKPVPQYDASEITLSSSAKSANNFSGGSTTELGEQRDPFATYPSSPTQTDNNSHNSSPIAGAAQKDIARKTSIPELAARPIHYLIPDMPVPQSP